MASSSILLSEEQVQCSICLDVFTEPVSTPCGHNFCKACIRGYWDTTDLCYCPLCKEKFNTRPELRVNTFIAEMTAQLKKLGPAKVTPVAPKLVLIQHGAVPCDVCTGIKFNALKSCLVCLASYCETHLEPHHRVASFKKHKLIHPVENLEDRVCKKHERPLELFCRTDQMCVCQFCTETDHKAHKTVPIEEEFRVRKAQMGQIRSEVQNMIQERQQKVKEIKLSAENSKTETEKGISESVKVFTALVRCIERCQAELIEVIEEKQKAAEKKTEALIKELQQEITELQKRSTKLEEFSHTEDLLPFLQSSQDLSTLPHTKDWSEIRVDIDLSVGPLRRAVSQLEKTLHEELTDIKLRTMKQYAVDVTLDPDTAHPDLILSEDGKQVRLGQRKHTLSKNPERFDFAVCVLGKQGFSSGRCYYEVQVKGKTGWVLGVARVSINRKGDLERSPVKGHWALGLWGRGKYKAHAGPDVLLHLRDEPQKVGVFVDYEKGEVTFYDVEARSHIYSFTGCSFTEIIYPCFSTGVNDDGITAAPLIICPVNLRH